MPPKAPLNPRTFPRPPLLERTSRHLQVKWNGELVADTKESYWVLETMHPPSEFILIRFLFGEELECTYKTLGLLYSHL